ncbi:MAG: NADH-quinone oxidoreductase subunit L [Raineya sp.]|jgi:NADH-quinone oxidoreductase subunit L|nr:NADH-quinone oxidoreductase subunit L [Raineya sp.]
MDNKTLALLALLLPFIGFLINGLGFRRLPKPLVGLVAVAMPLASFIITLILFGKFQSGGSKSMTFIYANWIAIHDITISFSLLIDQLSLIMLSFVTGVGTLIHVYSAGYMGEDEGYGKFMAYLNLFMFSMLALIMGSNYMIMFIGWEGVGLCSFLLIGFWNKNRPYNAAAQKAFVMNRIGDLGLILGVFLIFIFFGTSEYKDIEAFVGAETNPYKVGAWQVVTITILLFVGAMGKSAQVPLYTWLPDAMAGPTPVSALIHAATMVTAGIYMVVRSNFLYSLAPATLDIVLVIALITALLAASIGIFQNDIKKVLAYSTVSQLGYMFMALGVASYTSGMFHVITHAFFKALLFLGAGSVIHALHHEQDIRNMGGLRKYMPITFITFLVATLAISGIPPFAGFFSKDEILMHLYQKSPVLWVLGVAGSAMTSFYMFRLFFLTFLGEFRGTEEQRHHLHESPISITLPLMILAVLSIGGGLIGIPEVFAKDANWLAKFTAPLFTTSQKLNPQLFNHAHLSHSTEYILMGVSVVVAIGSIIFAYIKFVANRTVPKPETEQQGIGKVLANKYYVDELYNTVFVKPILAFSRFLGESFEVFVDLIVEGFGQIVKGLGNAFRKLQTGSIGVYLFAIVIGAVIWIAFNLFIYK